MAKELVYPSDAQVAAACDGNEAAEAVQKLVRAHMPASNAVKANRQQWVDGITARVDAHLAKAAKEAVKSPAPSKVVQNEPKQPKTPPDGGNKPDATQ